MPPLSQFGHAWLGQWSQHGQKLLDSLSGWVCRPCGPDVHRFVPYGYGTIVFPCLGQRDCEVDPGAGPGDRPECWVRVAQLDGLTRPNAGTRSLAKPYVCRTRVIRQVLIRT